MDELARITATQAIMALKARYFRAMDTKEGPAKFFPGGHVKFDEKGRRVGAPLVIIQWQNGEPVTVFPPEAAFAKPVWPKS